MSKKSKEFRNLKLTDERNYFKPFKYPEFYEYWLNILSGRRTSKSKKITSQMQTYLDFYGYDYLLKFIRK